jgi:hypothetical protein
VHAICLPWDYPRDMVVKNLCFWSEQYWLQAFLSFNSSFEVIWASSAMQASYPGALEAAFPYWKDSYQKAAKVRAPLRSHARWSARLAFQLLDGSSLVFPRAGSIHPSVKLS